MTTTKKLVTKQFHVENAKQFLSANNELFVYVGKHTPYTGGDDNITDPDDSVEMSVNDVYDNMIFAKRVSATNMVHMIPRVVWTANTVYDMYDHRDGDLADKDFYVAVDAGSEYNVFKCLDNAGGANSVVAPTRVGSNADLETIITGDEYAWKYMYTITSSDWNKFATTGYIPLTANSTVIDAAIPGTIEVIVIEDGGQGYNNYIANGVFTTGDIKVNGTDNVYGAPESAAGLDGYYIGCVMKITSGTGVDQYRKIVGYDGTSSPKTFNLASGFTTVPEVGDTYEVYPYIYVFGDGGETTPAEAIAYVDEDASNSIIRVEMLDVGAGYRSATTTVGETPESDANSSLLSLPSVITSSNTFVAAQLTPIISPAGGHGSDPYQELFANRICVYTKFANTEGAQIPVENDFRQIGIISNPKLHNIDIFFSTNTAVGTFSVGETVYQFKNIRLDGNVEVSTSSNAITKSDVGKISTTITIANGGINYNSTTNNSLVFTAPEGGGVTAVATFANNANGTITTITVTNQGTTYQLAPTVTVSPSAGGSNAVLTAALVNPEETYFQDAFEIGDYILVQTSTNNWINTVVSVPYDYSITVSANSPFTSNTARVSKIELGASGIVTSVSTGQITVSNVSGVFEEGKRIIGIETGATGVIRTSNSTFNALEINDKDPNGFEVLVQLVKLVGNLETGTEFELDEGVTQEQLIPYYNATGKVHHVDAGVSSNDDILYITNAKGLFTVDPTNLKPVIGDNSDAMLTYLATKYSGDFVKDTGKILYYENIEPISRGSTKSEIAKIILEF